MSSEIAIVIADAVRLREIRQDSPFSCRVLHFTDSNLVSALESIRAHKPRLVAVESNFAHTTEGRAFVDLLHRLAVPGCEIHLISFVKGQWTTSAPDATPIPVAASPVVCVNTRRVPRFPVLDPLAMVVDGKPTNLVDMSVMGAQVVSQPILRPNQKLKITLPDEGDEVLCLTAFVAWAAFEKPHNAPAAQFRAGMEFTDAAAQALEAYCRRHCADEPLIPRA
ncbi:MAG: hypothetical protein AUH72_15360 [Acidobacteria bacterium 13_1_40CM_4_65_8]|jgi:hypothetical protein|nr:MAG: hypothetical protein AUH72_15360 [Acidobacteria bacterium 13_1_40CM_4_65_8]OLE81042.1 MAG: hypothetical protein AUF76_13655 [Acidobacteria bacterium 13_1_20CM_2_65_9]